MCDDVFELQHCGAKSQCGSDAPITNAVLTTKKLVPLAYLWQVLLAMILLSYLVETRVNFSIF